MNLLSSASSISLAHAIAFYAFNSVAKSPPIVALFTFRIIYPRSQNHPFWVAISFTIRSL